LTSFFFLLAGCCVDPNYPYCIVCEVHCAIVLCVMPDGTAPSFSAEAESRRLLLRDVLIAFHTPIFVKSICRRHRIPFDLQFCYLFDSTCALLIVANLHSCFVSCVNRDSGLFLFYLSFPLFVFSTWTAARCSTSRATLTSNCSSCRPSPSLRHDNFACPFFPINLRCLFFAMLA